MNCESTYVRLIDHRIGGRMLGRSVRLPIEMVVGEDAFRRGGRVIDGGNAQINEGARRIIAPSGQEIPVSDAGDCSCIRIQKQLVWVETMALLRLVGSFDAIAIKLTRGNTSQPHMPDVTCAMACRIQINDLARRRIVSVPIELKTNPGRVTAEQNEIDSISVLMRTANRQWVSR